MGLSEERFAVRIRRGDARAFDEFFDAYAGPLLRYLDGMVGNRSTAEDLLQDTMVRVYRHIGAYREQGSFPAWVFRIATNAALSELRRRRWAAGQEPDEAALRIAAPRSAEPPEVLEAQERSRNLAAALEQLPDEQRAVLLLRIRQGMDIGEIATVLCIPPGTVKSRIHYAVRKLREVFDRHECAPAEDDGHDEL